MSAISSGSSAETNHPEGFTEVAGLLNEQLVRAVIASGSSELYRFFLLDRRADALHPLAVFCVANTVEPLGRDEVEQLRFSVPIRELDDEMPVSVLGTEADYFYLTYDALTEGVRTLRLDPNAYADHFESDHTPPVQELASKLVTYVVIPMRERAPDES